MQPRKNLHAIVELGLRKVEYPIPITYEGNATVDDLRQVSVVHLSGDDSCVWVADTESALFLLKRGHHVVKDEKILAKREAYRENPEFCQKYPFWYEGWML